MWICMVCSSEVSNNLKTCPYCEYKRGDRTDDRLHPDIKIEKR
jgi:hypothetical protein